MATLPSMMPGLYGLYKSNRDFTREIRHIVLGGGEQFLSPERRLDAALLSTPGLFD